VNQQKYFVSKQNHFAGKQKHFVNQHNHFVSEENNFGSIEKETQTQKKYHENKWRLRTLKRATIQRIHAKFTGLCQSA